jgi:hypothetical protein
MTEKKSENSLKLFSHEALLFLDGSAGYSIPLHRERQNCPCAGLHEHNH